MKVVFIPLLRHIRLCSRRYPYLGPVCWILTVQYFVAQVAAAMAAKSVYNWGRDAISMLGVTDCGLFQGSYVCSPLYSIFNLSLIGLGVAMAIGAALMYHEFSKSFGTRLGFSAIVVAGMGCMLVGLFPANTVRSIHDFGTALSLIDGLVGIFALSVSLWEMPRRLRYVMLCGGMIALAGFVWLAVIFFLGLEFKGAAERLSSYAQILWLITFAVYVCVGHVVDRTPWLRHRD